MAEKNFNLIDENWIPVADIGLVSLKRIFSPDSPKSLGSMAREKIAILKFLLAIAQAAATPDDTDDWAELGAGGLGEKCLAYLEAQRGNFYLYGDKPFLQMPIIAKADCKPYGYLLPEVATGNTSRLTHLQCEPEITDSLRAISLLCEMSMALAGKKIDKSVVISPGWEKSSSGYAGPGMCHMGLQHSFLTGASILETVWLNLLSREDISGITALPEGLGVPPWEKMPQGEDCETARKLKQSLQGRLVPLSRFCLLAENGAHYTEGVRHPSYLQGVCDPSAASAPAGTSKKIKMLWVDPEKRPWRSLPALLSFMADQKGSSSFSCLYLKKGIERLGFRRDNWDEIGIWCGGLRVSSTAGEQYVSGLDDNVESEFHIRREYIDAKWYAHLRNEMLWLEKLGSVLYGCIAGYWNDQKLEKGMAGDSAAGGTDLFWQKAETLFDELITACGIEDESGADARKGMRGKFRQLMVETYDESCPHDAARRLQHWANHRPGPNAGSEKKSKTKKQEQADL